jgi:hypothetical protein
MFRLFNDTVPTTNVHYCQIIFAVGSFVFNGSGRKDWMIFEFLFRYLPEAAAISHDVT